MDESSMRRLMVDCMEKIFEDKLRPLIDRLDRHEKLLREIHSKLDTIQNNRIDILSQFKHDDLLCSPSDNGLCAEMFSPSSTMDYASTTELLIENMKDEMGEEQSEIADMSSLLGDPMALLASALSSLPRKKRQSDAGAGGSKCPVCMKLFARADNLRMHMRIHTGEKPYKCQYCEYRSSQKSCLYYHTRIHTGELPHACSECGKKFARPIQLKKHIESKHS